MHAPRVPHLEGVKRTFRIKKTSPRKYLLFGIHRYMKVKAFTDADWDVSIDDRRSIGGYFLLMAIQLLGEVKSSFVVAKSSADAEYRAMAHGVAVYCG